MSGDTEKASIWGDADVYIAEVGSTIPASENVALGAQWGLVGLLDGEAGFEESRSRDTTDYFGWGGILIRTSRRNFVLTRKFTALEDNPVVRKLVWPGSTAGQLVIPDPNYKFLIAFETMDGSKKKRVISKRYAMVDEVGAIKDSESDLTKYEITVKIYPSADKVLFIEQPAFAVASALTAIAITPATKAVKVNEVAQRLTVTATYADGSTKNVTNDATWTSSAPTKATVDVGYVQGVAAGTSNIVASFAGQNATCAVTVSV